MLEAEPFDCDKIDWDSLPSLVHPLGGQLPPERSGKKCQQLENLAQAVIEIAKPGNKTSSDLHTFQHADYKWHKNSSKLVSKWNLDGGNHNKWSKCELKLVYNWSTIGLQLV